MPWRWPTTGASPPRRRRSRVAAVAVRRAARWRSRVAAVAVRRAHGGGVGQQRSRCEEPHGPCGAHEKRGPECRRRLPGPRWAPSAFRIPFDFPGSVRSRSVSRAPFVFPGPAGLHSAFRTPLDFPGLSRFCPGSVRSRPAPFGFPATVRPRWADFGSLCGGGAGAGTGGVTPCRARCSR